MRRKFTKGHNDNRMKGHEMDGTYSTNMIKEKFRINRHREIRRGQNI
jgi:hypothetical protein